MITRMVVARLRITRPEERKKERKKENPDNGIVPVNIHPTFLDVAQKQNAIGWYSTLLGFIHKDVIAYQHQSYHYTQSRRTGTSWAKNVTKKFWNFIYQMWAERNRMLHNTNTRDEFQGLTQLETSIRVELNRGLRNLPSSIYHNHFRIQPDEVTSMTTSANRLEKHIWMQSLMTFHIMMSSENGSASIQSALHSQYSRATIPLGQEAIAS